MQTIPFKLKIQKEHEVVLKELSKFRNYWEGKFLSNDKIQTYCNLVNYLSDLHFTYVNNCIEYFTPSMKQQMLRIQKALIDDVIKKLKHFQSPFANNDIFKSNLRQVKQTCHLCFSKIREIDVRIIKEQLADDASLRKSLLKKMYANLQNQNAQLFTKEEDQVFFNFLNIILVKKQELLTMQTQQIKDFLLKVTKSFNDLNFLTEYTPVKLSSNEYKQNYKEVMEKTIMESLKLGFNDKVNPWVHKVFESLKKSIWLDKRKSYIDESQQTQVQMDMNKKRQEYVASSESRRELDLLKQQVQKHVLIVDELKAEITVLTKQKKQLEDYYTKEVNQLRVGKRSIQLELKKTQTQFHNLKTLKDTQIFQLNKKLDKQKKKTQPKHPKPNQNDQSQDKQDSGKFSAEPQSHLQSQLDQDPNHKQENQNQFKKKKINLKRLVSNKSDHNRGSFRSNYKSTTDLGLINSTNNLKNTFNSPTYHYEPQQHSIINPKRTIPVDSLPSNHINESKQEIHETETNQINVAQQFLKEIKSRQKNKKSKVTQRNTSKQELFQQNTPKIQFKLDSLNCYKENIPAIDEQSHSSQIDLNDLSITGSAPKMNKRKYSHKIKPENSQRINKRTSKRMLSIEMKISPFMKASQSIYKPKNQPTKFSQAIKVFNPSNNVTKGVVSSKKKVFEYVPLQNQQEYESLKEKVNEITSRFEMRNNEKLKIKKSVKYIKEQKSSPELAKIYGFSIFSKKFSQLMKQTNKNYSQEKDRNNNKVLNRSKDSKESQVESQQNGERNIMIENKLSKSIAKSERKRVTSRRVRPEIADYSQQTENYSASINCQLSPIDHIPVEQRQSLFNNLASQSIIPASLTFHHYEMIVRKLFAQQKSEPTNDSNPKLIKSRFSPFNTNDDKKDKQKQSVKINIDGKFFETIDPQKIHQTFRPSHHTSLIFGKPLMNLPKINHSPSVLVSAPHNISYQINTLINPNFIVQAQKNPKSLFHTLRQSRTQFKDQNNAVDKSHQVKSKNRNLPCIDEVSTKEQNHTNQIKQSINPVESLLNPISQNPKNNTGDSNKNQSPSVSKSKTPRIEHPSTSIFQCLNQKYVHVFQPNDIKLLFDSQLAAYQYQQLNKMQPHSYSHQNSSLKTYKLNQNDHESIKSLYEVLNQIKQKDNEIYYKICSFVKSPYQSVRSGFDFMNTAKEICLEAWTHYLTKIYSMRKVETVRYTQNKQNIPLNCKGNTHNNSTSFTKFLKPFEEKLVQLLILAQK